MMRAIFGDTPPQWWARRTIAGLLTSAQRHGEITETVDLGYFVEALLTLIHPFTLHTQRTNPGFTNERIIAGLARIVAALAKG